MSEAVPYHVHSKKIASEGNGRKLEGQIRVKAKISRMTPWNMTTLSRDEGEKLQVEIWREEKNGWQKSPISPRPRDGLWETCKKKTQGKEG